MSISSPGIGSNLDVNGIVSKLMQAESQPLSRLAAKEANFQAQISAYGGLNGALSAFQSTMAGLANANTFQSVTATSSDSTVLSASATNTAWAGTYNINVTALPQAQSLAGVGQVSNTASLGNAATSLSFQFGTAGTPTSFGAAKTVSIAAGSSLQAIAAAVNSANIGVSAAVMSDGSASPYRIVFQATQSGAANSMSMTSADANLSGIMAYDQVGATGTTMTQTLAAQNAALTVNNLPIQSASTSLSDVIPGVTLNLAKVGTSTLTVAQDTSAIRGAVQSFVKAYNDVNKTLKSLTAYDPATRQAGPLQGDATVMRLQADIRRTLSSSLPGQSGLTNLSQVGVSFQKDGTLLLDDAKLQTAITSNASDIAGLFAAAGKITDTKVSFLGSTESTQPGVYGINVSTLARQGASTGSIDLNLSNTVIGAGTSILVSLDGTSSAVSLAEGSYTASQFATMVQSAINGNTTFAGAGSAVTASIDAATGGLTLLSNRYGAVSNVSLATSTGTAVDTFMGTPTATAGLDVVGTINGITAGGSGQTLTSLDGLQLKIEGDTIGDRGFVSFSQGYAYQLNKQITSALSANGISARTTGINRSIADISKQREAMNLRLVAKEAQYRAQFTQLDTLLSSMSQTSNYLTQQLAVIADTK